MTCAVTYLNKAFGHTLSMHYVIIIRILSGLHNITTTLLSSYMQVESPNRLNPNSIIVRGLAFSLEGGPKYTERGHKFLERKIGGHKIFDDQNLGSHKMTTDSVFILFKKTDFNTILPCLGDKVYR